MAFKVRDHFFLQAKKQHYLARSVYKLAEIHQKFHLFSPGHRVLDLGYYPGSWTQYASQAVGDQGRVVGVDLQAAQEKLRPLKNVTLHQRDVFTLRTLSELQATAPFHIILSDMAPQTTGIKAVDQAQSAQLVQKVLQLLPCFLHTGGSLVAKIFASQEASELLKQAKKHFGTTYRLRPQSTRRSSKEFFFIATSFITPSPSSHSQEKLLVQN